MKIAIVKLSALGDIIHAMVILQFIKKYGEDIQIDWIVDAGYKELLEFHPDINKLHVINIKKAKQRKSIYLFLNELRRVRKLGPYDLVIDMQGLIKSALITRLIHAPIFIGFNWSSIREGFASLLYNKTLNYGYDKNIIERNISLIEFALGANISKQQIDNKLPYLFPSQKYLNSNLSNTKKNVVLIPGASHESKCYPISCFAKLITLFDANFFVTWGNKKEKILADRLKILAPSVNVCEKLSIDSLISLISQMDLIIGPDTGPTHMGWALNIPSITLFGPTPGDRNSYVTQVNQIIESNSEVNPFKIDKNDYSIKDISVKEIQTICKELLK
jgi:heptosyltransferase-1